MTLKIRNQTSFESISNCKDGFNLSNSLSLLQWPTSEHHGKNYARGSGNLACNRDSQEATLCQYTWMPEWGSPQLQPSSYNHREIQHQGIPSPHVDRRPKAPGALRTSTTQPPIKSTIFHTLHLSIMLSLSSVIHRQNHFH